MPSTSSSVSVGRPIMKYSLRRDQPEAKAASAAPKISSSVSCLRITSRSRCVPASGAKVRPVLRTSWILFASDTEKASARSEGSDTPTPCGPNRSTSRVTNSSMWE